MRLNEAERLFDHCKTKCVIPHLTNLQHTKASDEEIVSEYLKTQSSALFDVLYTRYSGKIYGKSISLLKDDVAAQDAVQDIFMKIILNLSKFSEKSRFSTWIYSITYNYCIDVLRRKKKIQKTFSEENLDNLDVVEEVDDQFLLETGVKRLKIILNKISVEDKSVLMMKYQDEMSIKEICEVLEKSESAVKMKIKRAKHKFKRIYQQSYND